MEDVVSLPRTFYRVFSLPANLSPFLRSPLKRRDYKGAATFKSWPFFFLAHCHRAFHFPTSKLAFSGAFPKEENAREINHTFTAPFMSRHKRLLKNGCSLREKNIFLGNKKFRFSRKIRILTFPCNIIMYYNGKWKI